MEAVEVITDENIDIPEWQMNLVMEEREKIKSNPSLLIDWEEAKKK